MTEPGPPRLPRLSAFLLLRALCKTARPQGRALQSVFAADALDRTHLARYRAAFGFPGEGIPLTYHYLAVQRAHLLTMLDDAFPFRIAGMVHISNLLEELMPMNADQPYQLHTRIEIEAPAENGARYCECVTEARQHGQTVFRCSSRYLAMRGTARRRSAAHVAGEPAFVSIGGWQVAADDGWRYAALSGDWNPIHLGRWPARLLGLQRPIIHGMHTLAKTCALLEQAEGKTMRFLNCRFRSPVPLGAGVAISMQAENGSFRLTCEEQVAVEGSFRN